MVAQPNNDSLLVISYDMLGISVTRRMFCSFPFPSLRLRTAKVKPSPTTNEANFLDNSLTLESLSSKIHFSSDFAMLFHGKFSAFSFLRGLGLNEPLVQVEEHVLIPDTMTCHNVFGECNGLTTDLLSTDTFMRIHLVPWFLNIDLEKDIHQKDSLITHNSVKTIGN